MVYNSAVLASRPAELTTANKNCEMGLQKRLTKRLFCCGKLDLNTKSTDI